MPQTHSLLPLNGTQSRHSRYVNSLTSSPHVQTYSRSVPHCRSSPPICTHNYPQYSVSFVACFSYFHRRFANLTKGGFLCPSAQLWKFCKITLKICHDRFLPHPSQLNIVAPGQCNWKQSAAKQSQQQWLFIGCPQ